MSDTSLFSGRDLREQREKIRRSFLRANTAIAVVLVAVLGLALAAVLASGRASRSQQRAELAEHDAREKLWNSYLAQARAARLGGQRGYRLQSLTAVSNAAAFRPTTELRNEAIAALTASDLEHEGPLHPVGLPHRTAIQPGLALYGIASPFGHLTLHQMSNHVEVARIGVEGFGLPKGSLMLGFEFGGDQRHVFTVFKNGFAAAWDVKGGPPVWTRTNTAGRRLIGVTSASDSRLCVAESAGTNSIIKLVKLPSGAEQMSMTVTGVVQGASLRPGTNHVALCYGYELQLWDYSRGEHVLSFRTPTPGREPIWSRDGSQVALANAEGTIYLQNVASDRFQTLIGHVEKLRSMTFSPDGSTLLSASWDNTSRLWDTTSGRAVVACTAELGFAFSEDGGRIGYVKLGDGIGTWRYERSPFLETLQQSPHISRAIAHIDLSPQNRWLLAVTSGGVFLWDLSKLNSLPAFLPLKGVSTATIHPDDTRVLLCRDGQVELRDILGREPGEVLALGPPEPISVPSSSKSFQATIALDGRTLLVESQNHNYRVMDLKRERAPVQLKGRPRFRHYFTPATGTGSGRLAISPDGRWVALGYGILSTNGPERESSVAAWDARTGEMVFHPEDRFGSVMFTPDSRHLLLRSVDSCLIFNVGSWELERTFALDDLAGQVGTMAMPEEGRFIAAVHSRQVVGLLESETGKEIARLTIPFAGSANQLRCAGDGSRLAVVTPEARIHLWNLKALQQSLAGLGLDWSDTRQPRISTDGVASTRALAGNSFRTIVAGFLGVAAAMFAAFVVLRRHRQLITRFVRTEATVEKRDLQLESARLELMQAEKMKALGTLAAGIAHDFNNLLSVIRMSNQLIPRSRSPKETTEYVSAVEQAVLQGKLVVGSMLGYSREAAPDDTPADLCTLVEEAALLLSKEFLSGIELKLNLDRTTPKVRINKGKLQQALLNLVVNAAEALKGTGRLTLSVMATKALPELPGSRFATRPRASESYVQIAVADTGPGIPAEILDRIFEPFFTTKTAGTRKGTGLGLSLVHTVASQEGLGLAVHSKPGAGATFYLFIPAG